MATKDPNMKVLLVDEDAEVVWTVGKALTRSGFSVVTCGDGGEALSLLESQDMDVLITAIRLSRVNGLALVDWARNNKPDLKVVVITSADSPAIKNLTLSKGVLLYLEKPVDTDLLIRVLSESDRKEAFRGSIDEIDILDYVQLMMLSGRKLVLEVSSREGETGLLFIDTGEFSHALCGGQEGDEAVIKCLSFSGGSFVNLPWTEPERLTVKKPGRFLLIEAARQRDEKRVGAEEDSSDWLD